MDSRRERAIKTAVNKFKRFCVATPTPSIFFIHLLFFAILAKTAKGEFVIEKNGSRS